MVSRRFDPALDVQAPANGNGAAGPPIAAAVWEDRGFERSMPQDRLAEQCVLGAMLLSRSAIGAVVDIVSAADFYLPAHGRIFEAVLDLFGRGEPADPVTVATALSDAGDLGRVGGAPYLHTLINAVPTAANAAYYARPVVEKAKLRRLIEAGTKAVQLGYASDGDADGLIDRAQQAMYDLTSTRTAGDWSRMVDLFPGALDGIEAAAESPEGLRGLPTGFLDLDRLLNGLGGGELSVFAGRPSMGKSTAAADVARHVAIKHGETAAIFSLEMPKSEIILRLLSAEARVPLNVLRSGKLSDDDWTRLARRMGEIGDAPLFIDDTASVNLMEIRSKARRLKQRHNLKLIVVDYLQLMTSARRVESRQQEVAELARGLKLLAKEVDCHVIAVSQLNRGPEQRADKRPLMSDLRESGAIEQDSDVVILLHRDDYYDKESPRAGEADWIVAKNRNGPTDVVTVAAQLHLSRFVDMAVV